MSEYYNEVFANLSWYQLNSDFKDPMFQYMDKLEREVHAREIAPLSTTSYSVQDDFIVNYKNATPRYGSYQCSVPGKEAFLESDFSCFLFQLPFFLENIQFGYIGFAFVIPIMLISIFGGIKESYKWFILHQAIWDAFLCYDFICAKPTLLVWSTPAIYAKQSTCFYRQPMDSGSSTFIYILFQAFRVFLRNASFIPIFHLAFSRFLCMYFPIFYKKFTKNGYKICIFLIAFNVFCIAIFAASATYQTITVASLGQGGGKCDIYCPIKNNNTYCMQNFPKFFQCQNGYYLDFLAAAKLQQTNARIIKYISYSIPPIMFLLSIICAGFLFYKIASQLKFQLKANPESFKQTIKISSVVGFQCLTMSVIFVITGIQKFMQIKAEALGTYKIYEELPVWLLLLQYYTTTASLNMIRILLDSCIILTVLSGYSKCVILIFKFLCLCLINPKKAFYKIKYSIKGTEVTVISNTQK